MFKLLAEVSMKILIDADGCPVVNALVRMAKEPSIGCFILCDSSHFFEKSGATTMTFSCAFQKNAIVINQDGMEYIAHNLDSLLLARHMARKNPQLGRETEGP